MSYLRNLYTRFSLLGYFTLYTHVILREFRTFVLKLELLKRSTQTETQKAHLYLVHY